jgi:hypothetical protein
MVFKMNTFKKNNKIMTFKVLLNIISDLFLETNNILYSNLTAGW